MNLVGNSEAHPFPFMFYPCWKASKVWKIENFDNKSTQVCWALVIILWLSFSNLKNCQQVIWLLEVKRKFVLQGVGLNGILKFIEPSQFFHMQGLTTLIVVVFWKFKQLLNTSQYQLNYKDPKGEYKE
jgi:hypothetical protein